MNSNFFDFYLFPASDEKQLAGRLNGQNARHILAVLDEREPSKEITAFFGKILSAVNLDMEKDVLLLHLTMPENISFSNLHHKYTIEYTLLFGVEPRQLGLHLSLPFYQAAYHNGVYYLRAHSLSEISKERQEGGKKKAGALWKALQQLFLKPETE